MLPVIYLMSLVQYIPVRMKAIFLNGNSASLIDFGVINVEDRKSPKLKTITPPTQICFKFFMTPIQFWFSMCK